MKLIGENSSRVMNMRMFRVLLGVTGKNRGIMEGI
jgi:hypothetical protein